MKFPKNTLALLLLTALFLTGCTAEDNSNFWTAETCNQRIETDIQTFEEYQTEFEKIKLQMETDARSGNATRAEANKKSAGSRKQSTKSLLKFIESNIMPVCKGKIRSDFLAKIEDARKFARGAVLTNVQAEGMPDLRVANVTSTFVPYEFDQYNRCEGPFLNLVITVTNQGADFPRPVDLQIYTERAQRQAEELQFFTVIGELDFGGDMKKRLDFEIKGDRGSLKNGASLEIPTKVKVENNQTHAKVKGSVAMGGFLKTKEGTAPYETEIDIPIWDIYTESHTAIGSKDEDGKYYIGTKATVTNKSQTPTPGPIQGSFIINDIDPATRRRITGWSGKTSGSVSGSTDIYEKTYSDLKLPAKIEVISFIIPLCPDGTVGNLADGDTKNNIRTLEQR